ncbi:MAG: hypothetical protein M1829_003174 [Trizodia sp. TS-e1964]|nr:MAG: hypothetical protein M1829_003174 [Trizodia sp. TS-e1964]
MMHSKPKTLPLIPLEKNALLLPGASLRIPFALRPDIAAIFSHFSSRAGAAQHETVFGCLPLKPPGGASDTTSQRAGDAFNVRERIEIDPARADREDLFEYGTLAKVSGFSGPGTGIIVEGIARFRVDRITKDRPFFEANVTYLNEKAIPITPTARKLFAHLKQVSLELLSLLRLSPALPTASVPSMTPLFLRRLEIYVTKRDINDAGVLADLMCNFAEGPPEAKIQVLASWDINTRVQKTIELLEGQANIIKGNVQIAPIAEAPTFSDLMQIIKKHRESLSRRGLSIQGIGSFPPGLSLPPGFSGAGDGGNDEGDEIEDLKKKLDEANLTPEAQLVAQKELKRLKKMNPIQAEYQVCRNYLENIAEIPWGNTSEDLLGPDTLARARNQLDDDHYGLDKIKKRLLEYLAVLRLKQSINADLDVRIAKIRELASAAATANKENSENPPNDAIQLLQEKKLIDKSPILLLVGPPGTGKTSLARSVATALGRKFHRMSLGGVRDESEIRGHRRTYVGAMPGIIVSGLKKAGVTNPVFLLDEIDKVGTANFKGDPSAAMLEVLDPEQNHSFRDHYIGIPIDLSKVLFIATANSLETIPPALLDRMETIALSGYTTLEKRHIASRHLIPKQILTNGLGKRQVRFPLDVIDKIITSYTREAGVRNLEREIGSVCRSKAVKYAEAKDSSSPESYSPEVSLADLESILGIERFEDELAEKSSRPGVVTGLVAYSVGGNGSILFIEISEFPGSGAVQLTGKLGDVLKESVEVALTWVKAHAYELGLTDDPTVDLMKSRSIHVHCPAGAVPKDGPSAGLAHTIALISLFAGKAVPPHVAMTGEISLRGRVLPVGGINEKLIGALRAGVKTVLLPLRNQKDVIDLPDEVKDGLEIVHVRHIWEAMRYVWPEAHWPGEAHLTEVESRL